MYLLSKLRDTLAGRPYLFTFLRKCIELNFRTQKRIIRECIHGQKRLKALDIGCGTGEFAPLFAAHEYYGIDISPAYIAYAAKKRAGRFAVMDATRLKHSDSSFDFVLVMAILHHLSDDRARQVLAEALRVLVPGGRLLVMEDAKVPHLENTLVRLVQRYDRGAHIREPAHYRALAEGSVKVAWEKSFRNGGCVYYAFQGIKP